MELADLRRKAQELCYISVKTASFLKDFQLRQRIEDLSYQFIESLYGSDFSLAKQSLESLQGVVALASNTGKINPQNADLLLKAAESIDLNREHHSPDLISSTQIKKSLKFVAEPKKENKVKNLNKATIESSSKKAKLRQERIISTVQDLKKAQLRDIIGKLPDLSERTIRYDLRQLCLKNRLLRHGAGGPGNYYTIPGGVLAQKGPKIDPYLDSLEEEKPQF